MARTLRLNVLGPFQAQWSDGTPLEVTGKKIQGLLGYLAVESARPHSREQVAALLWSETGDERARHNLRQALSKIRRTYGPMIASTGESLSLDLQMCSVDVRDFRSLARSKDVSDLARCMKLYRDDLLDGLLLREALFDEWLLGGQHQLRRTACEVIERLAASLVDADRAEEAVDVLNRRIDMDPACEPAHRHLMELYEQLGRRSDALRQYQYLTEALEQQLGAKPEPETLAAYDRIRGGKSAVPAPSSTRASAKEAAPVERELPTVAVVPFDNLSGPDDAYFVDGMVEDIITALSHFSSLMVISRGSTFALRGREVSNRQVADELGAQFIVRGSVRRSGKRVRISVQLLDALAGSTLWAHRFDRELEDVFVVQDELSSTIVSTLAGRVEAARLDKARRAPPERLDAYDYILRGKEHHHRYTAEDCRAAIQMFERAVDRDPGYSQAHAWLACGLGQAMAYRPSEYSALLDQAEAAAQRGLELDACDSECLRILAQIAMLRRNLELAVRHQERGLFLNPNDDRSVCAMGEFLSFWGRSEEAEGWIRKAMRLNPYHPPRYWSHLARVLFHLGRFQDALDALKNIRAPRVRERAYQAAASYGLGDPELIRTSVRALREVKPDFDPVRFVGALPYDADADRQALIDALQGALD
ncbi:MAG: BTAD domain-containing putative transcriptional regulator [Polyangiales bacterium]|jgi:adenylate cyclase